MELSKAEKLILAMLCDIHEHLKVQSDIDSKLVKSALWGDKTWGLTWEYSMLFGGSIEKPEGVSEVVDILDMWSAIESYYGRLSPEDQQLVKSEVRRFGGDLRFPGFDGNDEVEGNYMSISEFLVNDLHRFGSFRGRDFNSHHPFLDMYRGMVKAFSKVRPQIPDSPLSAAQIISIFKSGDNAEAVGK
ncbi:MAG TPA: YfbU family protein [Candidatus Limnocylindrales bacterium]|nr:YfbU family protein [Candidatus Limnocylindrales bacterium]